MKCTIKVSTWFLGSLFLVNSLKAQENAPWQKFKDVTVSNVFLGPGCHEHSLSGGQGYSVYLKNMNNYPVNVTAWLVAKNTCGKENYSKLNINLAANEIATGDNFTKGSETGQTSYVTEADCKGNKYTKDPRKLDRINEVYVKDVVVTSLGNAETTTTTTEVLTAPKTQVSTQVATTAAKGFDSIAYYKNIWLAEKDALNTELDASKLNVQRLNDDLSFKTILLDSLTKLKTKAKTISAGNGNNSFALQAGVGYTVLPTFNNNTSSFQTTANTIAFPFIQMGVLAKLFNQSKFNVELNPFASYGNSLSKTDKADHLNYGILGNLLYSLTKSNNLKLVGSLGYMGRNGNWMKGNEVGDYNYNVVRYGGGLRYALNNNVWLQPTVVMDNFNETNNNKKSAMVINLDAGIKDWNIGVSYGSAYNMQGTALYSSPVEDKNMMSFRVLKNFDLR